MTQQEVADRLNVSNKTISKWERDDGYPEITIIPALAELFGVTSDEILRGERIPQSDQGSARNSAGVEKQVQHIVKSNMARFQNYSYLASALALTGLICLFTIAYAFYRPVIGLGIMLVFIIASITLELSLASTLRIYTRDHEIIKQNRELLKPLWKTANRHSFAVFMLNGAVLILSLPFIIFRDSYFIDSVISFETYLTWLPVLGLIIVLICAVLLNLLGAKLFIRKRQQPKTYPVKSMQRMNLIQGIFFFLTLIVVLVDVLRLETIYYPGPFLFFIFLCAAIIVMVVTVIKNRSRGGRILLLAAGLRNLLYIFVLLYFNSGLTYIALGSGESYYHYTFTPGPLLVFLGATAAYMLIHYYMLFRLDSDQGAL